LLASAQTKIRMVL